MSRFQRSVAALVLALSLAAGCSGDDDAGMSGADAAAAVDGAATPTWSGFAAGFFETYCFACHGPGDTLRDFSLLEMVRAEADTIRCGVAPEAVSGCEGAGVSPGQFPVGSGPKPSDAERWMIVSWIDGGTPE